jgi:hypothetical protein
MMKDTAKGYWMHMARVRVHGLVVVSCLVLALQGQVLESSGGWVSCPPRMAALVGIEGNSNRCGRRDTRDHCPGRDWRHWIAASWRIPVVRSVALLRVVGGG